MQNDSFCIAILRRKLHKTQGNSVKYSLLTPYGCTLIRHEKPTEELFFDFSGTLRGQILFELGILN